MQYFLFFLPLLPYRTVSYRSVSYRTVPYRTAPLLFGPALRCQSPAEVDRFDRRDSRLVVIFTYIYN